MNTFSLYANLLGLETESFSACLESRAKRDYVTFDLEDGISKNVRSTPSIYINGRLMDQWSYDKLRKEIQGRLG